jgi:catechol 2,3-dioxygenase-like lactoylglutathione lyase family enzyme
MTNEPTATDTEHVVPVLQVHRVDHVGKTVPDMAEATRSSRRCPATPSRGHRDPPPWAASGSAAISTSRRTPSCGKSASTAVTTRPSKLFEYRLPGQGRSPVRNCDVGGHHAAFHVDDIDLAVEALRAAGVQVLGEPSESPGSRTRWVYFVSPCGENFELVSDMPD